MVEFHEREVVRRAGVSKGSANSILRRLARVGLLERRRRGRMVFYRLNLKNAVSRQVKILFTTYFLNSLVELLRLNSRKIVLFGSAAEGSDVKESDVDLFVLTADKQSVRKAISNFQARSDRRISPIVVNANDLLRLRREDRPLYERISKGIVLWESE